MVSVTINGPPSAIGFALMAGSLFYCLAMHGIRGWWDEDRGYYDRNLSEVTILEVDIIREVFHIPYCNRSRVDRWHQGAVQLAMWKGWRYSFTGEHWGTSFQKVNKMVQVCRVVYFGKDP